MDISELSHEQAAKLTPEQITILESEPGRLDEFLEAAEPEQEEQDSAANGAGKDARDGEAEDGSDGSDAKTPDESGDEEEPVVLTKSGKGTIPYSKHKALRVENSTLREQNEQMREQLAKLQELAQAKADAPDAEAEDIADEALQAHLSTMEQDMPELHQVISAMVNRSRRQGEKLEQTLAMLEKQRQQEEERRNLTVQEQVTEAKENNPDLVHWEEHDEDAWNEAMRQDEALRIDPKWADRTYDERFTEVVRRVRAIMPDASNPSRQPSAEQTAAEAKARLKEAPARKPTTLSDIHGGANPTSEAEQAANISGLELARRLMKMPESQAAAMRAGLD